MKEKYTFFIGLGLGLVIASIISLFSYNILSTSNIENKNITTNTSYKIDESTESTTLIDTSETVTEKPMELSTN